MGGVGRRTRTRRTQPDRSECTDPDLDRSHQSPPRSPSSLLASRAYSHGTPKPPGRPDEAEAARRGERGICSAALEAMAAEASSGHLSRYVKLTRDQDAPGSGGEDIRPGELNQPVAIPHLEGRKCGECGQVLPESYQAPADEPWTTGIFGCAEDPESCRTGLFCPCVLFGLNVQAIREDIPWTTPCTCHAVCVEGGIALAILTAVFHGVDPGTSVLIGEGLVFSWWLCSTYTGIFRQNLQKKYHLKNSPCDPCLVHCCLHWCANCQEHRERKGRLMDNSAVPMTIVNPPSVQEMSMAENHTSTSENEAPKTEHDEVEVIPL